jgi:hypothetical protein
MVNNVYDVNGKRTISKVIALDNEFVYEKVLNYKVKDWLYSLPVFRIFWKCFIRLTNN